MQHDQVQLGFGEVDAFESGELAHTPAFRQQLLKGQILGNGFAIDIGLSFLVTKRQ